MNKRLKDLLDIKSAIDEIHADAHDKFLDWDVLGGKCPSVCQHMQGLNFALEKLNDLIESENESS